MRSKKQQAVDLIKKKISGNSFMSFKEIADVTGYHPKYLLRLKKEVLEGTVHVEHQAKNKRGNRAISKEEEEKIVNLYKRANASIRKFAKFYGRRSYSCIYNVLDRNGLIEKDE